MKTFNQELSVQRLPADSRRTVFTKLSLLCKFSSLAWGWQGRTNIHSIAAPGPLAPLLRLLLPAVIFRVQAHICSSPQVPFCSWTAHSVGSQFRALGLGCRGGKSSPGRSRRAWSYLRAGGQLDRAWEICSQTIRLRSWGILPQWTGSDRPCAVEER